MIEKTSTEAESTGKPVLQYFFDESFHLQLTARSLFESYVKQLLDFLTSIGKSWPQDIRRQILEFYGPKS